MKCAIITGGSRGIGRAICLKLAEEKNYHLLINYTSNEALANETLEKVKELGTTGEILKFDVSNAEETTNVLTDWQDKNPDAIVEVIINNAGMMRLIDLQDQSLDLENINREIATNLTGTIQMVHQFLPHLLKQKSAGIVNVTSGIAFMSYSPAPIYSATKAGVRAYTQALRLQLEDTNVKVFEMIPPGVKTNLQNDWVKQPNERMMMNADDMVKVAIDGLLKDKKELKPLPIRIIKFATRLIPNVLLNFGHKEFKEIKKLQNSN